MFFKSRGFKNIKYDIPACQKQITQIHTYKYIYFGKTGASMISNMIPEPTTTTTTDPDPMTMDPTPTDPMTTNS